MARLAKEFYDFGPFRLIPQERLLQRCGEAISLTPKAFDLLLALVEQSGHLLEKEVLLKAVWPDSFVEENSLADNISRLRKALGERENGQKFIETVPKRGYRFVAEVRTNGVEPKPAVEEPTKPASDGGVLPVSRVTRSAANFWINRLRIMLFVLTVVVVVSAAGVWSYSRLQQRAETPVQGGLLRDQVDRTGDQDGNRILQPCARFRSKFCRGFQRAGWGLALPCRLAPCSTGSDSEG